MVTVSLTALVGVVVALLVRSYRLSLLAATVCIVFGFLLASTPLAPMIGQMIGQVTQMISSV